MTTTFLGLSIEQWSAVTNVGLTFGLLFFAGMQWWVTKKADEAQQQQRKADEKAAAKEAERMDDLAFQTVWAEHFRIQALAAQWEKLDLVSMAALGVLRAGELLPRDWPTVMRALGALGTESGYLGGVALTLAHDAERDVAVLNGIVEGMARQYAGRGPEEIAQLVRHNRAKEVELLQQDIRRRASDLALLLWDAAQHSPRANVQRTMNFRDDMVSDFGRAAVAGLKAREATTNAAAGKRLASDSSSPRPDEKSGEGK